MDELAFTSATRLAADVRDRRVGCLELLDHFLARAERHNTALNAVVAWQIEVARDRARGADAALARGEVWGPLHGVPMTVKESFNITGLPTTWGNPPWKDNIATENAVVVERLLQAGAIIYGKTNVPLMLMDSQSYNDVYGTTNNPWDTARGPGGSSGGEGAALAAGLSALGAGSDIAGSLRNPAHYCGVYGHKPTWGLISSRGQSPAGAPTPTDISVVGPMARYAEDIDEEARAPLGDAEQHRLFMLLLRAATASRMSDKDFAAQKAIAAGLEDGDNSFRAAVARGATLDHRAWGIANEARTKLRHAWQEFFQRYDVLLTPVAATAAFLHDHNPDRDRRLVAVNGRQVPYGDQRFWAGVPSLSYLPATAAPVGLTAAGLPVGVQIIGAEGEDSTTIEFARLLAAEIGGFTPPPGFT